MNIQAFHTFRKTAYAALRDRRLLDAIDQLDELAIFAQQQSARDTLYVLRQDYAMLLEYMKSGRSDINRQQHFEEFLRKAYALADRICRKFVVKHSDCQEAFVYQRLRSSAEDVAEVYIPFVEGQDGKPATISQIIADPLASYQQLFDTVWVSGHWTADQRKEFENYVMDDTALRLNRLAMVSAAGMALFLSFDEQKFLFLLGVIEEHQVEISVRALTFCLLLFTIYRNRLSLYPAIQLKLKFLSELTYFHPLVLEVQKALLLAPHNPELASKIDNELPNRILTAHEQVKGLPSDATEEDIESYLEENPKARRFHREMLDMMHDFVTMQEKGVDLSYQTFSHMHAIIPFFRDVANWFCPFSFDHPMLFNVNAAARFFSVVVNNKACDTERFAVFFTIAPHLPEIHVVQQDALTMEETKMEGDEAQNFIEHLAEQMEREDAEGEHSLLTIKPMRLHRQVVSCVQDCYRFFALYGRPVATKDEEDAPDGVSNRRSVYPVKEAFSTSINPFEMDLCFWLDNEFEVIFDHPDAQRDLANWLFELKDFEGAIPLYHGLQGDADIYQHKGYAYEQLNEFSAALDNYRKALRLDSDNEWLRLQIASCYRDAHLYEAGTAFLEECVAGAPENLRYSRLLAEMYLRSEDFEKAKAVYIKNDYLHPHHLPTLRALAWCCLGLREYEKADEYYLAILSSSKVQANDYLNAGHCALLRNDIPSALLYYQEFLRVSSLDFAPPKFFEDDSIFLQQRGVDLMTQRLVIDLLNV